MIGHRHIDKICIFAALAALLITALFTQGEALGIKPLSASPGYETRLFDDSRYTPLTCSLKTGKPFLQPLPPKPTFSAMSS